MRIFKLGQNQLPVYKNRTFICVEGLLGLWVNIGWIYKWESKRKKTQNQYSRRGSIFEKLKVLGERVPAPILRVTWPEKLRRSRPPPLIRAALGPPIFKKNSVKIPTLHSSTYYFDERDRNKNTREKQIIQEEVQQHQRTRSFFTVNPIFCYITLFIALTRKSNAFWIFFMTRRLFPA